MSEATEVKVDAAGSSKDAEPEGATRSVLRQIEYYFSDSNYPKDKFLMAEVAKSDEGWVELLTIANFNKMKQMVPSQDVAVIADALGYSNFLQVSDDGTKVRRPGLVKKKVMLGPLEFNSREEVVTYARGLIAEGDAATGGAISEEGQAFVSSLLDLHDKAAEKRGDGSITIKVGRNPDFPDTSCFVVVRADDTEVDFSYLKCLEKIFPVPARKDGKAPGSSKKRKAGDEGGGSAKRLATEEAKPVEYTKGQILVIKDLVDGLDYNDVKDKFGGLDKGCAYVELVPDMPLAYVRFNTAEQAQVGLTVEGVGSCELLEGDDEKQYWEKISTGGGGRGSGGKGGGRGGFRKGRGRGGSDYSSSSGGSGGGGSARKRLRALERLLKAKGSQMPEDVRSSKEAEMAALQTAAQKQKRIAREKAFSRKYHGVKFVERRKVERKIQQLQRQISEATADGDGDAAALEAELQEAQHDLLYIRNYPRAKKYLSLFPANGQDNEYVAKRKRRLRALIVRRVEAGLPVGRPIDDDGDDDEVDGLFALAQGEEPVADDDFFANDEPDEEEDGAGGGDEEDVADEDGEAEHDDFFERTVDDEDGEEPAAPSQTSKKVKAGSKRRQRGDGEDASPGRNAGEAKPRKKKKKAAAVDAD